MKPHFGQSNRPAQSPSPIEFDDGTIDLARRFARSMIGSAGITRDDVEEITQELLRRLLDRAKSFNSGRGTWRAFSTTVLMNLASSYLRDARALKRNRHGVISLSRPVRSDDGHGSTLSDRLGDNQRHSRSRRAPRTPLERCQLKLDVDATLAKLAPCDREVAELLKFQSTAEVAREKRMPRTTLYSFLRRIRAVFEDERLREHL